MKKLMAIMASLVLVAFAQYAAADGAATFNGETAILPAQNGTAVGKVVGDIGGGTQNDKLAGTNGSLSFGANDLVRVSIVEPVWPEINAKDLNLVDEGLKTNTMLASTVAPAWLKVKDANAARADFSSFPPAVVRQAIFRTGGFAAIQKARAELLSI